MPLDEARIEIGRFECGMSDEPGKKSDVGLQPADLRLAERRSEAPDRRIAISTPDDQLGDHRIVIDRDGIAGFHAGIDAYVLAGRKHQMRELAGLRKEAAVRVFGIKPCLDGVTAYHKIVLRERQLLA